MKSVAQVAVVAAVLVTLHASAVDQAVGQRLAGQVDNVDVFSSGRPADYARSYYAVPGKRYFKRRELPWFNVSRMMLA